MVAGQNCKSRIWRINWQADDAVGGAVVSGTVVYSNVVTRFQQLPQQQLLLQQGLETQRTYSANIIPGTLDVRERDELEITEPNNHIYYGKFFRIVNVRYADFVPSDPRNYLMLTLMRSVRSHKEQ